MADSGREAPGTERAANVHVDARAKPEDAERSDVDGRRAAAGQNQGVGAGSGRQHEHIVVQVTGRAPRGPGERVAAPRPELRWDNIPETGVAVMLKFMEARALSLLRIVAGFAFSLHGFQKLFGVFGGVGGGGAAAAFPSLIWIAGVLETFGGLLVVAGLFTRPVALVLSGQMAVAYFMVHSPRGFWPILNGGELAVLYCFIFLYLAVAGPGTVSLDRLLRRRSVTR